MSKVKREFTITDRLIALQADLWRPSGSPVVLGANDTVAFRMVDSNNGATVIDNNNCSIVSRGNNNTNTPARVKYEWTSADANNAGNYTGWFVRSSNGQTEHFPPQDYDTPELEIVFWSNGT